MLFLQLVCCHCRCGYLFLLFHQTVRIRFVWSKFVFRLYFHQQTRTIFTKNKNFRWTFFRWFIESLIHTLISIYIYTAHSCSSKNHIKCDIKCLSTHNKNKYSKIFAVCYIWFVADWSIKYDIWLFSHFEFSANGKFFYDFIPLTLLKWKTNKINPNDIKKIGTIKRIITFYWWKKEKNPFEFEKSKSKMDFFSFVLYHWAQLEPIICTSNCDFHLLSLQLCSMYVSK